MAYSYSKYVIGVDAPAGTTTFNLTFTGYNPGYQNRSHVYLYVNGVQQGGAGGIDPDGFDWTTNTQVTLKTYSPVDDDVIMFRREAPLSDVYVKFTDAAMITGDQLNTSNRYLLECVHEIHDGFVDNFDEYEETLAALVTTASGFADDAEASAIDAETAQTAAEAAQTAAETAQTGAETAQTAAETARDKAQDWAEEDYGVEVETGEYSAKHWANVAAGLIDTKDNSIINGCFRFWSYATSQSTGGYGCADRWLHTLSGYTGTYSQQVFTPGQTDVPGEPKYYFRSNVNAGAGTNDNAGFQQRMPDVRTGAGQQCTVSFYAKTTVAKNVAIEILRDYGTAGSARDNAVHVETVALTTSWTRHSFTFTMPSLTGKTIDDAADDHFVAMYIWLGAGSAWDSRTNTLGHNSGVCDFWGFKFEINSEMTPFVQRPYLTELRNCAFFYNEVRLSSLTAVGPFRSSISGTAMKGNNVHWPMMRAIPAATNVTTTQQITYYGHNGVGSVTGGAGDPFIVPNSPHGGYVQEDIAGTSGAIYSGAMVGATMITRLSAEL